MQTIRQHIISLLEENEMSAKELSQSVKVREKEVYDHLFHIQRSLKGKKKKLHVNPYQCLGCNYIFENRKRLTCPGRCPNCKQSRIEAATYQID